MATSACPGVRGVETLAWSFPGAGSCVVVLTWAVFVMDPVVKDSDYTVSAILAEGFPQDVQALYKTFSATYASQNIINLTLVCDLGQ